MESGGGGGGGGRQVAIDGRSLRRSFEGGGRGGRALHVVSAFATRPKIGQLMEGYSIPVEGVVVRKAPGGIGVMTVTLFSNKPDVIDAGASEPFDPVFEVEMAQLERLIERYPKFKDLFPNPDGTTEFSEAQGVQLQNFQAWEELSEGKRATKMNLDKLSADFCKLALKKLRGETTFLLFAPVARITKQSRKVSRTIKCGTVVDAPPGFAAGDLPADYKYLLTSDRCTRTGLAGKWEQVQEFTGAEDWDADLYPSA